MTLSMILRTLFEIILFSAVVWGIFNESSLAAFEKRLLCTFKRKRLKIAKSDCRRALDSGR